MSLRSLVTAVWLLHADPAFLPPRALRGMYSLLDGRDASCVQVDEELAETLAAEGQCIQAGRHAVVCRGQPHRLMFRTRYQCDEILRRRDG